MTSRATRAAFIDAARGSAMILVLIAHFSWIYFERNPGHAAGDWILTAMMVASPTFMLLSGILLGYVYEERGGALGSFGAKLVDRGLFLLSIGHVIIALAYVGYGGGLARAARFAQITDAIGVAIIAGPLLIARLSPRVRVWGALALYVLAWSLVASWKPATEPARWLKDTLSGTPPGPERRWLYNFPILPWSCLYLAATVAGQHLARLRRSGSPVRVERWLVRCGIMATLGAAALKGSHFLAARAGLLDHVAHRDLLYLLTHPFTKRPPGPAFLLFFGGIGLMLLALAHRAERTGLWPRAMALSCTLGRNSLFIFLLQEHVYVTWLWLLAPPYSVLWPLLMLATIVLVVGLTLLWDRAGSTRWFSVGYGRWWGPSTPGWGAA